MSKDTEAPSAPKNEELALTATNTGVVARMRQATDAAHACRDIVMKTAVDIQGRKYVKVEGWQTIAAVHGFIAGIRPDSVKMDSDGCTAVAELKRAHDGVVVSTAEGFVGVDEAVWYGGKETRFSKKHNKEMTFTYPKRANYAIRNMAQTRGISRVCRGVLAHVVVLIDENLSTVPYEEMIDVEATEIVDEGGKPEPKKEQQGGGQQQSGGPGAGEQRKEPDVPRGEITELSKQFADGKWKEVEMHFSKDKGKKLGDMTDSKLKWWIANCAPKPINGAVQEDDKLLRAALDAADREIAH